MALLRKMTYKDTASYESSPPCILRIYLFLHTLSFHLSVIFDCTCCERSCLRVHTSIFAYSCRVFWYSVYFFFCTHFPVIYSSRAFAHRNMKVSRLRIATSRYKSDMTHSQYRDSWSVHQKTENLYKRTHFKKSCLQQSQSEFLNSLLASEYAIYNHYQSDVRESPLAHELKNYSFHKHKMNHAINKHNEPHEPHKLGHHKHHKNFSKPREFSNTRKISQHHENFPTPQKFLNITRISQHHKNSPREFLNTTRIFQHYENFSTDSTLRDVPYTISIKLMFVD